LAFGNLTLALLGGSVIAVGMYCIERMLIASVSADATWLGRIFALVWRAALASITTAAITLPFWLLSFQAGIAGQQDRKGISLVNSTRIQIGQAYGVPALAAQIDRTNGLIDQIRERRESLPSEVREFSTQASTCDQEKRSLQVQTETKIKSNNAQIDRLRNRAFGSGSDIQRFQPEISWLLSDNAKLRNGLAEKGRICVKLAQRFAEAKTKYYSELDEERERLNTRLGEDEKALSLAKSETKSRAKISESKITAETAPGLQADTRALFELAKQDPLVLAIMLVYYIGVLLVELMPILAKILVRSIYEYRVRVRVRRASAQAESEIAKAEAEAAVTKIEAAALVAGTQRYHQESLGEHFYEAARAKAQFNINALKADLFQKHIENSLLGIGDAASKIDMTEKKHANNSFVQRQIESIREFIKANMVRSTSFQRGLH
jgi:hypothetical protein